VKCRRESPPSDVSIRFAVSLRDSLSASHPRILPALSISPDGAAGDRTSASSESLAGRVRSFSKSIEPRSSKSAGFFHVIFIPIAASLACAVLRFYRPAIPHARCFWRDVSAVSAVSASRARQALPQVCLTYRCIGFTHVSCFLLSSVTCRATRVALPRFRVGGIVSVHTSRSARGYAHHDNTRGLTRTVHSAIVSLSPSGGRGEEEERGKKRGKHSALSAVRTRTGARQPADVESRADVARCAKSAARRIPPPLFFSLRFSSSPLPFYFPLSGAHPTPRHPPSPSSPPGTPVRDGRVM